MAGLYYPQQIAKPLIGSKNKTSFAVSTSLLTTVYTGNSKIIAIDYAPEAVLYCEYTPGSGGGGNAVKLKIEFSPDGVNFSQETVELDVIGTTTEYIQERYFDNNAGSVAGTTYAFRIPVKLADKFLRVSAKEILTSGSAGAFFCEALISGKA